MPCTITTSKLEASYRSTKNDLPCTCHGDCKGRYPHVPVCLMGIGVKDEAVSSSAPSTTTPIILPPHIATACSTSLNVAPTSRTTRARNVPACTCDAGCAADHYWATTSVYKKKAETTTTSRSSPLRGFFPLLTLLALVMRIVASTVIVMRWFARRKQLRQSISQRPGLRSSSFIKLTHVMQAV